VQVFGPGYDQTLFKGLFDVSIATVPLLKPSPNFPFSMLSPLF